MMTFAKKHVDLWICLFLIIMTLGVYGQTATFEFVFDDRVYVTENPYVRQGITFEGIKWGVAGVHANFWHPLTTLSHMMDVQLFGMNPGAHHLTNVGLHTVNALLLFFIFLRMTGERWKSGIIAALFALHPLHVESVAWISERKDVLSIFWGLLCIYSYTAYVKHPTLKKYLATLILFACSLLAKPTLVTLPFLFVLFDYWPFGRIQCQPSGASLLKATGVGFKRIVWEKIPFIVFSGIACVAAVVAQQSGDAMPSLDEFSLSLRISNALVVYVKYIVKTLWPLHLAVNYPHPKAIPSWQVAGALIILLLISFFVFKKAASRPAYVVGWLWYLGTLLPVIGLVQVGAHEMADRYTYFPLIGLSLFLVGLIFDETDHFPWGKKFRVLFFAGLFGTLIPLSILQTGYWENDLTLFQHAIEKTSRNPGAQYNLGVALFRLGKQDEAIGCFYEALKDYPEFDDAHNNLGVIFAGRGDVRKAIYHYTQALRINPNNRLARNNLKKVMDAVEKLKIPVK